MIAITIKNVVMTLIVIGLTLSKIYSVFRFQLILFEISHFCLVFLILISKEVNEVIYFLHRPLAFWHLFDIVSIFENRQKRQKSEVFGKFDWSKDIFVTHRTYSTFLDRCYHNIILFDFFIEGSNVKKHHIVLCHGVKYYVTFRIMGHNWTIKVLPMRLVYFRNKMKIPTKSGRILRCERISQWTFPLQ